MFETKAVIHSLSKSKPEDPFDIVNIIHEDGDDPNDVVAEYNGVRYAAIFNVFNCWYYVDDLYGELKDQSRCPRCGATIE